MKNKINQIRITIPKWIAELKEWDMKTHLEVVPKIEEKDKHITKDALIIIKEVKKNGQPRNN